MLSLAPLTVCVIIRPDVTFFCDLHYDVSPRRVVIVPPLTRHSRSK